MEGDLAGRPYHVDQWSVLYNEELLWRHDGMNNKGDCHLGMKSAGSVELFRNLLREGG
jgi:hypothetical protein